MSASPTRESVSDPSALPHVTDKSTKADILAAYRELQEKYEKDALQSPNRERATRESHEQETVTQVEQLPVQKIIEESIALERQLREKLADIREKMTTEAEKFKNLRDAVTIEDTRLQEMYEMK